MRLMIQVLGYSNFLERIALLQRNRPRGVEAPATNKMSNQDDVIQDMEKGSDLPTTEQPRETEATKVRSSHRVWKIIGALTLLGLAAFVIAFPILLIRNDGNESSAEAPEIPETSKDDGSDTEALQQKEFVSSTSPFDVRLALFSEEITRGYDDEAELEEDLRNVARFLLNNVLSRNTGKRGFEGVGIGRPNPNFFEAMPMAPAAPTDADAQFAPPPQAGTAERVPESGKVGDEFDDYGTNNQEEGSEEGDKLVSDGENGKPHLPLLVISTRSAF